MAFANPRLDYHRPHPDSRHPAYFDEDDADVLDPAILEADIMQSPNGAQYRKGSFANSNGVISPADSHTWDHQYSAGLPVESTAGGASSAFQQSNNGFVQQGAPHVHSHPAAFGHPPHGSSWAYEHPSGNCTPAGVDYVPPPAPYDGVQYQLHRTDGAPTNAQHPSMVPPPLAFHGEPGFNPAPQVQTPMSPHSHQDWMGMAQQEMEGRPLPKRMRPNSPPTTMVDFARRDGIRKKNGRIDIPQERNINTIDDLIDRTTDEDTLKELKQQKRLLRNREAALASRQRKKKHTEDLEVREKNFNNTISMLEKDVADLSIDCQRREEERQALFHRVQEYQRVIDTMHEEIRNLKIQHNEETSQLRKRVNILTDQLEVQAPAMSAAPSSTGFTDFNAEMEALNMGPHEWEDFFFVENMQNDSPEDFTFNQRPQPVRQSPVLEKRPSSSTIVPSPQRKQNESTSDQPFATGLLFMLLLCGAFVASKPASSRPADLPNMPPEVQAAAPAVLKDLLAETSGASHSTSSSAAMRAVQHHDREPQPSGLSYAGQRPSRLEQMHHRLTTPSKQQEIDQAFSLSAAQYASITNMNYPGYEEHSGPSHHEPGPRPRRVLAEALAGLQQEHQQNSKADVYTRSLLWSQIPTETVKQFKEMVRDHEEIEARQQRRASQTYKTEA